MVLRQPSIRCVSACAASLRAPQRRWAKVRDIRFVTQQASERITDRYKEKLEQKRKEVGASSISELKDKYKEKIHELRKDATVPEVEVFNEAMSRSQKQTPPPSTTANLYPPPPPPPQPQQSKPSSPVPKDKGVKTLESFLDLEKVQTLSPEQVDALWRFRHANSPSSLYASVPAGTWKSISKTARKHPLFILPGLPRQEPGSEQAENAPSEGAPIHFMQWQFTTPTTVTVIFTHLAEYKVRGEHAQPHTTLTHHINLQDSHGLVLCEGSVIEGRGVNLDEAKWLVMNMQKFYNIGEEVEKQESSSVSKQLKQRRRELVEKFSSGSQDFRVEDLLAETERMG